MLTSSARPYKFAEAVTMNPSVNVADKPGTRAQPVGTYLPERAIHRMVVELDGELVGFNNGPACTPQELLQQVCSNYLPARKAQDKLVCKIDTHQRLVIVGYMVTGWFYAGAKMPVCQA